MQQLSFRKATPNDNDQIVGLLNGAFRTPIDRQTWEWFTGRNPIGPSRVYLATDQHLGEIAGVFGFAPIDLRINAAPVVASYAHHLVLKPEYRDGLSFLALSRYALNQQEVEGFQVVVGPPNRAAYQLHKKLMKWVDFGHLDCLRKLSPTLASHSCRELTAFPDEFNAFYGLIAARLAFCLGKTADWMNWRFFRRPDSPYTVYTTMRNGGWAGYVVLKQWLDPDGYRKAHIVDMHALDDAALSELTSAAEDYAAGCNELNVWAVRGYAYKSHLENRGFVLSASQPLIARTFAGFSTSFPDGDCSLTYGDGDSQY